MLASSAPIGAATEAASSAAAAADSLDAASLPVVIIGGGIAGLALAVALHGRGVPVRVYERDSGLSRRSYGLTMQAHGALADLGVLEGVLAVDSACPSLYHWTFAADGRVLGYYGRAYRGGGSGGGGGGGGNASAAPAAAAVAAPADAGAAAPAAPAAPLRGNLRIPREELRRLLLEHLPAGAVTWGAALEGFTADAHSVQVALSPPHAPLRARALVGADGIHSRVRRLMAAAAGCADGGALRYLGVLLMLGLSPAAHPLLSRGGFYTLDGGGRARLFTMPYSAELTMWQLSFAREDGAAAALRMNLTINLPSSFEICTDLCGCRNACVSIPIASSSIVFASVMVSSHHQKAAR